VGVAAGAGVGVGFVTGEGDAAAPADVPTDEAPAGVLEDPPQPTQAHNAAAARAVCSTPLIVLTFAGRIKGETLSWWRSAVKPRAAQRAEIIKIWAVSRVRFSQGRGA